MKRPTPRFDPREAAVEAKEAHRWQCQSCDAPIDPTQPQQYPGYCWPCGSYWADVAAGLWDD